MLSDALNHLSVTTLNILATLLSEFCFDCCITDLLSTRCEMHNFIVVDKNLSDYYRDINQYGLWFKPRLRIKTTAVSTVCELLISCSEHTIAAILCFVATFEPVAVNSSVGINKYGL